MLTLPGEGQSLNLVSKVDDLLFQFGTLLLQLSLNLFVAWFEVDQRIVVQFQKVGLDESYMLVLHHRFLLLIHGIHISWVCFPNHKLSIAYFAALAALGWNYLADRIFVYFDVPIFIKVLRLTVQRRPKLSRLIHALLTSSTSTKVTISLTTFVNVLQTSNTILRYDFGSNRLLDIKNIVLAIKVVLLVPDMHFILLFSKVTHFLFGFFNVALLDCYQALSHFFFRNSTLTQLNLGLACC